MMKFKKRTIAFTGGGSAGHCIPNVPIIKTLIEQGVEVIYIGSKEGPEKSIISKLGIKYFSIRVDKLRRYLSWKNLFSPFNVLIGFFQSLFILIKARPNVIFSKGGFVSLPVVLAGALLRIPIVAHESDLSPGLANKLSMPFIKILCTAVPTDWMINSTPHKLVYTGIPIRTEITKPKLESLKRFDLKNEDKVLFVFGGSLGAMAINEVIWDNLSSLLKEYTIIHAVGKGNLRLDLDGVKKYYQFEFIKDEMGSLLCRSDVIVCRAGMTSLLELIAIEKSAILVPLPISSSRGDQIENAKLMLQKGLFHVVFQEELETKNFLNEIRYFEKNKNEKTELLKKVNLNVSSSLIIKQLSKFLT